MEQWEDFVVDNNVWLVANWRQGMLTIGSKPDPSALHLTQGAVRVINGVNFWIFYYFYSKTYFCIFMSVLERLQFYIALHIHSQHINILHTYIFETVLNMLDTIHMLDTLDTNHVMTMLVKGINKPTYCVAPPWDAYLLIYYFLSMI